MKKVLVIAGPTATGKTRLSLMLAKQYDGEIISGDSQQVYRGLDIGTAKIKSDEMEGIPHHGIDLIDYWEPYSVKDFQIMARAAIEDISSRGKLPILVGGTGFYLKAVLYDYEFEEETEAKPDYSDQSDETLYARLVTLDPVSAAKIHLNNRKRVERALTIALQGELKSVIEDRQSHQPLYDDFMMVLTWPKDELDRRITQRVDQMFAQGLKDEVLDKYKDPISWTYQSFQAIGYKEWLPYLKGEATEEAVKERIVIATRQFAKRQMTWFRHQFPSRFVDLSDPNDEITCLKEIQAWIKEAK